MASPTPRGTVRKATEVAIRAASHLTDQDKGAVAALRALADKIDTDDALREAYLEWQVEREVVPSKPLQLDNVSIPTYLKFAESLGLTPAGREKLTVKATKVKGKLTELRAARGAAA